MVPDFYSADIQRDKQLIEAELRRIMAEEQPFYGQSVSECMNYALFSGGKRLRPLLGLQVAKALNCDPHACLTHLAAVEMLHSASLILDDMPCMDNAAFRRSQPSAHCQFGESIALLAAIAMITLATNLAETESAATSAISVRDFRRMLLNAFGRGGLIAGQEADLTHKAHPSISYAKTAPLFELSCAAGLVSADLRTAERDQIISFGRSYGRAFQAVDDFEDEGDHNAVSVSIELEQCGMILEKLESLRPGFVRLRKFRSFLEANRLVCLAHSQEP